MSKPQYAGNSLIESMWLRLDQLMDLLMGTSGEGKPLNDTLLSMQGEARGVAWCIALVADPYTIDVDHIRRVAMERWEKRQ